MFTFSVRNMAESIKKWEVKLMKLHNIMDISTVWLVQIETLWS